MQRAKGGIISIVLSLMIFGIILALSAGAMTLIGKVASGRQEVQVTQAQAEIAHEERLQVEAEQRPEEIEEQWQGITQYLLASSQVEADRDMRSALIKLALADYSRQERSQAFTYAAWTLVLCFFIGVVWWLAATKAVQ